VRSARGRRQNLDALHPNHEELKAKALREEAVDHFAGSDEPEAEADLYAQHKETARSEPAVNVIEPARS
jgi:hypothetical protein